MNAANESRLKPARLEVACPWELPQASKDVIAESIAGEAWLERMGLLGLLTGIANSDMRVFRSSVERLVGQLRYAREQGVEAALDGRVAELAKIEAQWRSGAVYAALAGVGFGVLLGIALAAAAL